MLVLSHHFFLVDYLQGVLLALLLDEVDVAEGTLAQFFLGEVSAQEHCFGF
jgi:hypothetical protein